MNALRRWFNELLLPRRLRYAKIAAVALWLTWLLSVVLGPGLMDLAGQVVGTDYLAFYAVGRTLRLGDGARLYDLEYQFDLQRQIIDPTFQDVYLYLMPPYLTWVFYPLAGLPYLASFALWSVLGLAGLWWGIRLVGSTTPKQTFIWVLTFFPIFASVSFGENALLSLTLFCVTYWLWMRDHPWLAGLACSLLLYKPYFVIGVVLLWLLRWREDWRALLGFGLGGAALVILCFVTLPEASIAYIDVVFGILPKLPSWGSGQIWHAQTIHEFLLFLLPGQKVLADVLRWLLNLAGLWGFVQFWRQHRQSRPLLYAAAVCFTQWVIPHAMIYDLSPLVIPAVLLLGARARSPLSLAQFIRRGVARAVVQWTVNLSPVGCAATAGRAPDIRPCLGNGILSSVSSIAARR